jgi:uncharacterized iron-regulated membrane protein
VYSKSIRYALIVVFYSNGGAFPGLGALIVVFYGNGRTFPGLGTLIVVVYGNGGTFPGLGALIVVFYSNGGTFPGLGAPIKKEATQKFSLLRQPQVCRNLWSPTRRPEKERKTK